ncbi:uncharacterized mitochondrial protein AtMg00810-like [Rutidosis leptorrhynchoides]|uniref:uncharacterized mitochondrial protein AtMg00810-like n=1 Tax=Rutidosis leptorrhynchoides TaxID=125765 RepID=UPI003A99329F
MFSKTDEVKIKIKIKDLGLLKYFHEIELVDKNNGLSLTQRKYTLEVTTKLGCLAVIIYQKLVGKLIYITLTRSGIAYVVHCLSQHMHAHMKSHLKVAFRAPRYLKGSPVSLKIKKQSTVSKSSVKAEYRALASFSMKAHFEVDLHFVREKIGVGVIEIGEICSNDNGLESHLVILEVWWQKCEKGFFVAANLKKVQGP